MKVSIFGDVSGYNLTGNMNLFLHVDGCLEKSVETEAFRDIQFCARSYRQTTK